MGTGSIHDVRWTAAQAVFRKHHTETPVLDACYARLGGGASLAYALEMCNGLGMCTVSNATGRLQMVHAPTGGYDCLTFLRSWLMFATLGLTLSPTFAWSRKRTRACQPCMATATAG